VSVSFLEETLETLKGVGLYRSLRVLASGPTPVATLDGKKVLLFSSNNYLGLSHHPKVIEASVQATRLYGTGGSASRLISGNSVLYTRLEEKIAQFKNTESAVVFPTGYAANLGTIQALAKPGDFILFDRLNHASLIDGCRLSGARMRSYRHKDVHELKRYLARRDPTRQTLVITDGIFSMDGDLAPLQEILLATGQENAMVMVDDAHATGVWGEGGCGTVPSAIEEKEFLVQMGTLSKAIGSLGGFVAGSHTLIRFLINEARSLIYSTALPPSVLAASLASFEVLEEEPEWLHTYWKKVHFFKKELVRLGYDLMGSETHIIPIRLGDNDRAVTFAKTLYEEGLLAPAIRPPTVPKKSSRVRLTPMATHTQAHLEEALDILKRVGRQMKII